MSISDVRTDDRARVTLPGAKKNSYYRVETYEDGSMLLQPARLVTENQREYDTSAALQDLLTRAASSSTVRRPRRRRTEYVSEKGS